MFKKQTNLIFDLFIHSRKRPYEPAEGEEFLPISKKLNNLHIGVRTQSDDSDNISNSSSNQRLDIANANINPNQHHGNPIHQYDTLQYMPSLSSSENPVYYESNRLLYEAHLSRLHRTTHRRRDAN